MPAPLNVDREAVRTLVVAVGVCEAARQMGISEDTVAAWSARGKWTAAIEAAKAKAAQNVIIPKNGTNSLQASASGASIQPADALANHLADDSKETKIGLSKATRSAAEHFRKMNGPGVIAKAKALRDITATAASLHGWEDKGSQGVTLNLGIAFNNMQ